MATTEYKKGPLARIVFENLITPGEKTDKKTKKPVPYYDCSLAWPKGSDISALTALVTEAAVAEWGEKARDLLKAGAIKNPFLDGDGPQAVSKKNGERYAGYEGTTFVRCGTYQRPKMMTAAMLPVETREELYRGCYVFPVLNAYTWTHETNGRGVSIGLSMVQVVKHGERLGGSGGGNPDDFFEKIEDEGPAPQSSDGAASLFG